MKRKIYVRINSKEQSISVRRGLFGSPVIYSGGWYTAMSIDDIISDFNGEETPI